MAPIYRRSAWRRFCRHRVAVGCLVMLAVLVLMALLAPLIAPYSPTKPVGPFSQPPGRGHLLGTDKIGRDMFSRILYAMRISLLRLPRKPFARSKTLLRRLRDATAQVALAIIVPYFFTCSCLTFSSFNSAFATA